MTDAHLSSDRERLGSLLASALDEAARFLDALDDQPVAHVVPRIEPLGLSGEGLGAACALDAFRQRCMPWISGSAGPRYFGFVTGGSTPAALVGDWLASVCDQNGSDAGASAARQIVLGMLRMFRDLGWPPGGVPGAFVTGATTSSTVALATARQWVGRARGVDASVDGAHPPMIGACGSRSSSCSRLSGHVLQ